MYMVKTEIFGADPKLRGLKKKPQFLGVRLMSKLITITLVNFLEKSS